MISKIHKLVKLPWRVIANFGEAYLLLIFSKIVIKIVPLKRLVSYFGILNGWTRKPKHFETMAAAEIKLAILMACEHLPWKSVCLDQAIACILMLKKRKIPYTFCLGVLKNLDKHKLDAHAWVECGGDILIGNFKGEEFTIVAAFSKNY